MKNEDDKSREIERDSERRDGEMKENGNKVHQIDSEAKQSFEKVNTKHSTMREKYLYVRTKQNKKKIKKRCAFVIKSRSQRTFSTTIVTTVSTTALDFRFEACE